MENAIENNVVTINITHDYWNCECCGGISDSSIEVIFPDKTNLFGHDDGHFGYSTWDGGISSAYIWILETLGISVIFDGKYLNVPYYHGYDEIENPIRKPLFMGPLRPLYIDKKGDTIHCDDGYGPYSYTIDKGVTFSLYAGETQSYYNEDGIEDDKQWNVFYSNVLSPYYQLVINEKEEFNEVEEEEEDYDYDGDVDIDDQ